MALIAIAIGGATTFVLGPWPDRRAVARRLLGIGLVIFIAWTAFSALLLPYQL